MAESLTGGHITSLLVENAGISNSLKESIVSYSNQSKINSLSVKEETIAKYGVVSSEVAYEMVQGLAQKSKTDIAISTTGYADVDIDAGLVYIGLYYQGEIITKKCQFNGDRSRVIDRASKEALNEIRKIILNNI